MQDDLQVRDDVVIPDHELEIDTSRAGGPGGQHVNKSDTRITVRWNVLQSTALSDELKNRVMTNLQSQLTNEGELIVHSSASRSQQQNKDAAFEQLAYKVLKALHVPKKRMATRVPKSAKAKRLESKARRGTIKKLRGNKNYDE